MTWNAIERNHVDILAHPWRFPWHRGLLDKATIEITEKVIRKAVERDVKIEFSRVIMTLIQQDIGKKDSQATNFSELVPWKGKYDHEILRVVPFFRDFFDMCQQLGAKFTLGSDAHKLGDIGVFPDLESCLNIVGIQQKNIVHVLKE